MGERFLHREHTDRERERSLPKHIESSTEPWLGYSMGTVLVYRHGLIVNYDYLDQKYWPGVCTVCTITTSHVKKYLYISYIYICIYLFLYFYVRILLCSQSVSHALEISVGSTSKSTFDIQFQAPVGRISQDVINSLGQLHFLEDINKCKPWSTVFIQPGRLQSY